MVKKQTKKELIPIPDERIIRRIFLIRDKKVMLDSDLAELYEVETRILVRNVKRNIERFPEEFMFQLNKEEFDDLKNHFTALNLKSQFGISRQWGGRRYPPYAFTEQGVAMLSSVLNSKRAIQLSNPCLNASPQLNFTTAPNARTASGAKELGTFLGFSDYSISSSKSFNPCSSTICRPLVADSLAVEDAMFSFFDIPTALIPSSRVPQ